MRPRHVERHVGGDYPELPTASDDAQHAEYAPPNYAGTETQGEVTISFGRGYRSDDDLQKVIVHEVQQSSQHYTNYQSEFRAYWIESGSGSAAPALGTTLCAYCLRARTAAQRSQCYNDGSKPVLVDALNSRTPLAHHGVNGAAKLQPRSSAKIPRTPFSFATASVRAACPSVLRAS